jgi:hypothetical protein
VVNTAIRRRAKSLARLSPAVRRTDTPDDTHATPSGDLIFWLSPG